MNSIIMNVSRTAFKPASFFMIGDALKKEPPAFDDDDPRPSILRYVKPEERLAMYETLKELARLRIQIAPLRMEIARLRVARFSPPKNKPKLNL